MKQGQQMLPWNQVKLMLVGQEVFFVRIHFGKDKANLQIRCDVDQIKGINNFSFPRAEPKGRGNISNKHAIKLRFRE
jgi:hypothetical protein